MNLQADDPNEVLGGFRAYLTLLTRVHIDPRLRHRVDLSGVVQQTLLEAHRAWERLRGLDEGQRAAWLRRVLANNLADEVRKLATAARDVRREQSLEAALDHSSARLANWLAAEQSSPSQRAERNEEALRLAAALEKLPEAQREALLLQHWHGWSLAEIAGHLGRTPPAVAGLLHRGLQQLRKHLEERE